MSESEVSDTPPSSTISSTVKECPRYDDVFQKVLSIVGNKREAKKMARMITIGKKVPFSITEQLFIKNQPEYQGRVSHEFFEVKKFIGFRVNENGVGLVRTQYEETEEPINLINIEINEAKQSFEEAGNSKEYQKMLEYANDHPECWENFFDKTMEEECEKADREREAKKKEEEAKKKEEEAKKQQEIESKLEAIGETVQLPKMNAVEPEEVPKQHPKKQPKQPYASKYYPTIAADPPVPITE